MPLQLRIWTGTLFVGFAAWFLFGVFGPYPLGTLPRFASPSISAQSVFFLGLPVFLPIGGFLLAGARGRLQAVGVRENMFYASALILASIPISFLIFAIAFGWLSAA